MSKRSRLYRKLENDSKRNFYLSIFGILVLFILLFKFGLPLLINFSLLISGSKQVSSSSSNSAEFVVPPQLNLLPTATNSAKFVLSGKSVPLATVSFYLNDNLVDKTQSDKKGEFSFDSALSKGDNKIYAKATLDNKSSDPSEILTVLFKDSKPTLSINSPSDGQQFSKDQNEISISGNTDSDVRVTVNGFWAIVDQSNNFNYKLKLQNGENVIKIEAVDQAGNKTEKEIKVKYSSI